MSSRPPAPNLPLSLGQRPGLSHDKRNDLGHAVTNDKFHKPRSKQGTFPYVEETEELEDPDIPFELLKKIHDKMATPYKSNDHLIGRSADKFTSVDGNRRVALESVAKGMVPFPGMYKKRLQVGGGVSSPTLIRPGQYNRTGTDRGWSHAPIDRHTNIEYDEDNTVDDISLEKVRKLVRSVLKKNNEET